MTLRFGAARPSIATRIAAWAGLLASVLLAAGAAGVRVAVHATQMQATQQLALAQAVQITDATRAGVSLFGAFGSLPYELVRSDGAVVAASPELAEAGADAGANAARMPLPSTEASQTVEQGWEVDPAFGVGTTAVSSTMRASSMTGVAADDLPGGPADKDTLVYRAYVFVSPAQADRVTAALDPIVWGAAVLGVVLLAGTAAIAARRALRPVDRIRAVAAGISDAPEGARVEVPESQDELHALTLTLNAMLARIDDAAARQKRFVADAAHELRSPLNSLLIALEVARAHPEALPPERTLAHVETEARRLADLADELLALSSAAASTPSTAPRCEVIALVRDAVAAAAEHSPVPVELTAPNEAVHVTIAPSALRRAIANLLDNASRHAATRVEVRVRVDPAGALVRIDVANDIAAEDAALSTDDIDRVFEPFVRLDDSRARATGGAGLGLAIVRETVTRAGGTASAASEWPLTTFTLTLPRAEPTTTTP